MSPAEKLVAAAQQIQAFISHRMNCHFIHQISDRCSCGADTALQKLREALKENGS